MRLHIALRFRKLAPERYGMHLRVVERTALLFDRCFHCLMLGVDLLSKRPD